MKHVVKYTESERGWGGEIWYQGFDTEDQAIDAITSCNKDNPESYVPDYYICAEYVGVTDKEIPKGYKI